MVVKSIVRKFYLAPYININNKMIIKNNSVILFTSTIDTFSCMGSKQLVYVTCQLDHIRETPYL